MATLQAQLESIGERLSPPQNPEPEPLAAARVPADPLWLAEKPELAATSVQVQPVV